MGATVRDSDRKHLCFFCKIQACYNLLQWARWALFHAGTKRELILYGKIRVTLKNDMVRKARLLFFTTSFAQSRSPFIFLPADVGSVWAAHTQVFIVQRSIRSISDVAEDPHRGDGCVLCNCWNSFRNSIPHSLGWNRSCQCGDRLYFAGATKEFRFHWLRACRCRLETGSGTSWRIFADKHELKMPVHWYMQDKCIYIYIYMYKYNSYTVLSF